ncbi:MAG TPA: RHS repeat-associated core domain-containing protein [Terriglobales bacterium]|nr:RHS repeat-associated core domain-containing protein [Terriglobales bacterium]
MQRGYLVFQDETSAAPGYQSFTGKKQDIDTAHSGGQYDFPAREYNPLQGRWWTPDPAGLAAVDPENPASWNRYACPCDPLDVVDPSGMSTCTVDIYINNKTHLDQAGISAIESRINQIFGATADGNGNTTQANFVSGAGDFELALFNVGPEGMLGLSQFTQGSADIFVAPMQSEFTSNFGLGAGTIAAHELIHRIAGVGDLPLKVGAELMTRDAAIESRDIKTPDVDAQSASVAGFAKLSQADASALYLNCIKLHPPRKKRAGGGALGDDGWFFFRAYDCGEGGNEECAAEGWIYDPGHRYH